MAAENFIKFLNEHLTNDQAAQKELDQHKHSTNDFVRTLVEVGSKNGYEFTAEEALELLPSEDDNMAALQKQADGELSDTDLAAVAGGASLGFTTNNLSSTSFSSSFSSFGGFKLTGAVAETSMCCW